MEGSAGCGSTGNGSMAGGGRAETGGNASACRFIKIDHIYDIPEVVQVPLPLHATLLGLRFRSLIYPPPALLNEAKYKNYVLVIKSCSSIVH